MNRNFHISKETEDKVKLAKQFIQNKYQGIIKQEMQYKSNWEKIIKIMNKSHLELTEKQQIEKRIIEHQNVKKRLLRQKDSLKNYQLYRTIGKGAFGQVRLAKNITTNEIVAIKRMEKKKLIGKKQISSAYLQKQFLMKNNSKFLVELKSTFQDRKYLYIAMEYVSGGDLLHLLIEKDIFTEEETKFYIAELVLAVEEVHRMNYIHRDIKPDNILLTKSGHIKISDFGLSKYLEVSSATLSADKGSKLTKMTSIRKNTQIKQGRGRKFSKVGTPDYISPQILTDQSYDHRVDIWSIGVIMFQCLFGYPPFSHEDSKEVCHRVMMWNQYLQFPAEINVSLQAKMLVLGMMSDRDERLSIQQIKQHQFFQGFDWKSVMRSKPPHIPKLNNELDTQNFEQFEDSNWRQIYETTTEKETNLQEDTNDGASHKKRSSSLVSPYYFAGFDCQRFPTENIFEQTAKQIQAINRFRICKSKSPNNKQKRLKTEQSALPNTFRKQKFKPSKPELAFTKKKSLKSTKQNMCEDFKQFKRDSKKMTKGCLLKKLCSKAKVIE